MGTPSCWGRLSAAAERTTVNPRQGDRRGDVHRSTWEITVRRTGRPPTLYMGAWYRLQASEEPSP
ncbi:hypothetical protein B005_1961 [Nocardiopsis alba ATCC BAA-2165]|uniref:Uncharacterized protein n=1 Tax=Nocardiopsis alba (strain ATCC BAA-2165 / BE74) TaxID=1205910 RepID=J7LBJ4_NOCAA|nr:hypothetical protein B005_1961 [Nocardiopsis alba ATCC BAA-2165]